LRKRRRLTDANRVGFGRSVGHSGTGAIDSGKPVTLIDGTRFHLVAPTLLTSAESSGMTSMPWELTALTAATGVIHLIEPLGRRTLVHAKVSRD
jgi:hypothetical protein